jgi:redox-sensitive bicupin YhaK (pirin superfamily)
MIVIRRSAERGHINRGWLDSYFTFSFADYYDERYNGFRSLRVLNDDRIEAGKGFGPHAHRDMEIITYMLEGHLRHRDSTGQRHVVGPNEVQTMSAGTGVVHSEFNASEVEPSHSIQIWIEPSAEDFSPSYQQISFSPADKRGHLLPLAGPDNARTIIHQSTRLYTSELPPNESVTHALAPGRHAYIQVVRGDVLLNGQLLHDGDGAALSQESKAELRGAGELGGESLLFDLD